MQLQNQDQLQQQYDNESLLTEESGNVNQQDMLQGFAHEYQIKIVNKLNYLQTKLLIWVLNLEIFLSLALIAFIYISQTQSGQFEIFSHFTLFFLVISSLEIFMRFTMSCYVRKEAEQFYSKQQKLLRYGIASRSSFSNCSIELCPIWSLLQLDGFYALSLCKKLQEYNSKMIDYDEVIYENRGRFIIRQSIQAFYSFVKFRQVYLNLRMCVLIMMLTNTYNFNQTLFYIIVAYIPLLVMLNIWINFHFAVVYLFYRQSHLSLKDTLYLIGEITLKCVHSVSFYYVFTHVQDILPYFSVFFLSACTIYATSITIQINSLFDSSSYSVFELIFLGYSTNHYIGLKHKEYFFNKIGYFYKTDIFKQVFIFSVQLTVLLVYYEENKSISNSQIIAIIAIVSFLALLRFGVILIKVNIYLKPKAIIVRLKTFQGTTCFIEEDKMSQQSNKPKNNESQLEKQKYPLEQGLDENINEDDQKPNIFDLQKSFNSNHSPIQLDFNKTRNLQKMKEIKIKEILNSKIEHNQYKITFFTESNISEFEMNPDMRCVLSEIVRYKRSEITFLISNQIKIWNQYGHINVLINKYDGNLMLFIERYIIPFSKSIQIDSCYKRNSDTFIQLMLLYNVINKELDPYSKITLKPIDLVQQLPLPYNRKQDYLTVINKIINSKTISLLKMIAYNKNISPLLFQHPCQVLYDLYLDHTN
ncbi:transmembrane protein, putative (macronuclear) [Tetrahymena thermophila SB210]|uniref:Transmembrane protein, putative n=1 Tax=Tetrahymena thermophila (strain SB210) TaxID=312017 RepID=Q23FD2_TETTS|nr:transmembrane protein, putative [Tetrahymena thermophila SB210]EAR95221.2 transmembrane protein, putative [Tetrahymena thermophila SB210]|eukprot:XP_001015466.2 transmembrane protein, putative [Tetrahymena thermophila SB210]